MKSKISCILAIIAVLLIISMNFFVSNADYGGIDTNIGDIGKGEEAQSSVYVTNQIAGILQVIGTIISVVALIIIGMRYMLSSVETKAQMKGVIGYYITGCILVFATSNVLGLAYDVVNDVQHYYNPDYDTTIRKATCVTPGIMRRKCDGNGGICSCTSGRPTYIEVDIPPTGIHELEERTVTAATCTANGVIVDKCKNCDHTENRRSVPAQNHNWAGTTRTYLYQAATCTSKAKYYYSCTRCGENEKNASHLYEGDYLPHNFIKKNPTFAYKISDATCTEAAKYWYVCSACNKASTTLQYTDGSARGHNWGSWRPGTPATCGTNGTNNRTCSRCSATETQTIAATGNHTYPQRWSVSVVRTCTKGDILTLTCTTCGYTKSKEDGVGYGHDYQHVNYPKTVAGATWHYERSVCTRCNAERKTKENCDYGVISGGKCKKCCQKKADKD